MPELANFYAEITDYKTAEDVGVDRPSSTSSCTIYRPRPTRRCS